MNYKKSINILGLLGLALASTSANAALFSGGCPAGTTGTSIGVGFIEPNGTFLADAFNGTTIFDCTAITTTASESSEVPITTQQINRTSSSTVNRHIMEKVFKAFSAEYFANNPENKAAASSDNNSYKPDTFWGETNLTQITEESGNVNIADFDTDIYQFVGGLDKRIGDLFFGTALTYAYTEFEVTGGNDSTMHTIGVTPYVAYRINEYLFASGLASYYYSHTNNIAGASDVDTHDYVVEGNINTFKVIDSVILKARAGVRYKHANASAVNGTIGRDNTYDELTGIVDGEIGYRFDNGITLFTGALYEYYDREQSSASARARDNIVLMRYGIDYPVYEGLTLGAKIENDLNDEDRDYFTGTVHFRLEL